MFTSQLKKSVLPPGLITPCSWEFAVELSEKETSVFLGLWWMWRQEGPGFSSALWEFGKILDEEHQECGGGAV